MTDGLEEELRRRLSPARADGPACATRLYAYAAGELSPGEAAAFEEHMRDCSECRQDLAAFERAANVAAARPRPSFWRRPWRPMLVAGCTLGVALFLWQVGAFRATPDRFAELRPKGGPRLTIAARRGADERVAPRDFLTGDTLGFFYSSPSPVWPMLFFCDERGTVSRIFPSGEPILLPAADNAALPAGVVIEPVSGCEWLVALFAPETERPALDDITATLRGALGAHGPGCQLTLPPLPGMATQVVPLARGR